jgi:isopenicillin N synthase-like dioxygenase
MNRILTLNFQDWLNKPNSFVKELGKSFTETGFFLLKDHPMPKGLLKYNKELFKIFFKTIQPEERMRYSFPDLYYQKGYTPMQTETGEYALIPDNKHFYQVGEIFSENPYVEEIPDLKKTSEELFKYFQIVYKDLMQAVAYSLCLPHTYFNNELGNSVMRVIHYPENSVIVSDDEDVMQGGNVLGMCASKHTDINDLTLLHATDPGLQLWFQNKWEPVLCNPDTIIVNVGDMLWHLTAGLYKSGIHRVVCEPGVERISCPFFGHRVDNASVEPLYELRGEEKNRFPFKTEGQFLKHRLDQIIKK